MTYPQAFRLINIAAALLALTATAPGKVDKSIPPMQTQPMSIKLPPIPSHQDGGPEQYILDGT